jgi:serine/threonine protein kinase
MSDFFKLLSSNPLVANVLLVILSIVITVLSSIYLIAFIQGREISFWPPKIGQRLGRTKEQSKPNISSAIDQSLSSPSFAYNEISQGSTEKSIDILSSARYSLVKKNLVGSTDRGLDIDSLSILELLAQTKYSTSVKCLVNNTPYLLKRTRKSFCDIEALKRLIGVHVNSRARSNRVKVKLIFPISVWVDAENVWELYPYYEHISLHSMVEKNRVKIQGECLGDIHNALFASIDKLHELGVLHRDVNPSNVLLLKEETSFSFQSEYKHFYGTLQLGITDFSFCCLEGTAQIPVGNRRYSPPEQLVGRAVKSSDYYSIASTLFFIAKGRYPFPEDKINFKNGIETLNTGSWGGNSVSRVWGNFLSDDLTQRSLDNYYLRECTAPGSGEFLGALDLNDLGSLILLDYDFGVIPRNNLRDFLLEKYNFQYDPDLEQF